MQTRCSKIKINILGPFHCFSLKEVEINTLRYIIKETNLLKWSEAVIKVFTKCSSLFFFTSKEIKGKHWENMEL